MVNRELLQTKSPAELPATLLPTEPHTSAIEGIARTSSRRRTEELEREGGRDEKAKKRIGGKEGVNRSGEPTSSTKTGGPPPGNHGTVPSRSPQIQEVNVAVEEVEESLANVEVEDFKSKTSSVKL